MKFYLRRDLLNLLPLILSYLPIFIVFPALIKLSCPVLVLCKTLSLYRAIQFLAIAYLTYKTATNEEFSRSHLEYFATGIILLRWVFNRLTRYQSYWQKYEATFNPKN